jgi:hypothetical protein
LARTAAGGRMPPVRAAFRCDVNRFRFARCVLIQPAGASFCVLCPV